MFSLTIDKSTVLGFIIIDQLLCIYCHYCLPSKVTPQFDCKATIQCEHFIYTFFSDAIEDRRFKNFEDSSYLLSNSLCDLHPLHYSKDR